MSALASLVLHNLNGSHWRCAGIPLSSVPFALCPRVDHRHDPTLTFPRGPMAEDVIVSTGNHDFVFLLFLRGVFLARFCDLQFVFAAFGELF